MYLRNSTFLLSQKYLLVGSPFHICKDQLYNIKIKKWNYSENTFVRIRDGNSTNLKK
jgi:hypothetical protein